jgi:hypothetical protein
MEKLQREVSTMLAIQAAQTSILTAIIQSHPNYDRLQIAMTSAIELMLGGPMGQVLDERERGVARDYVEWLQTVHSLPAQTQAGN